MAEEQDESQKTEDPTPKKLEESRKKGQVALSREVNHWLMLLAATLLVGVMAGPVLAGMMEFMKSYIEHAHDIPGGPGGIGFALSEGMKRTLSILLLPLLLLMFVAFIGPFAQVGPLFAPEAIKPDFSKLSLIKGFGRLFSKRSLMEFAKGVLKIAMVGVVGTIILYPYFDKMEHLIDTPMIVVLGEIQVLVVRLMIGVLIVVFVVAMADLVFQRYEHFKKMRMSRQEIKDEYKQTEGDPHVKGRLRQLRAERARQRMIQAVPNADVVITNPTHYSIALKYNSEEMNAPVCVAKGMDEIALRIREVAKENNIVLYENKPLARALYDTVEIDEVIPTEHFKAVAEVISYVFQLKGKLNPKIT